MVGVKKSHPNGMDLMSTNRLMKEVFKVYCVLSLPIIVLDVCIYSVINAYCFLVLSIDI